MQMRARGVDSVCSQPKLRGLRMHPPRASRVLLAVAALLCVQVGAQEEGETAPAPAEPAEEETVVGVSLQAVRSAAVVHAQCEGNGSRCKRVRLCHTRAHTHTHIAAAGLEGAVIGTCKRHAHTQTYTTHTRAYYAHATCTWYAHTCKHAHAYTLTQARIRIHAHAPLGPETGGRGQ